MNVLKSLLFACAFSLLLSTTASADEAKEKKLQGVRKAIDTCIELLEKRDYEGFIDKAVHPSVVKDIKENDENLTSYIDRLKLYRDEFMAGLKAAKKMEPKFRKSVIPREEDALFIFEKSILKDRDQRLMIFSDRDGVWYFES